MTATPGARSPLYALTTPLDKTIAINEGSSLWKFDIKPWTEQIDELVLNEIYSDALALLDVLDDEQVPDKVTTFHSSYCRQEVASLTCLLKIQRRTHIRALNAVAQFRAARFDEAINTFIDLDFNPAKVVALYSEPVSGRLGIPPDAWITLYGGPAPVDEDPPPSPRADSDREHETGELDKDKDTVKEIIPSKAAGSTTALLDAIASSTGSVGGRLKKTGLAGLHAILPSGVNKDDDSASITAKRKTVLHGMLQYPGPNLILV